MTVKNNARSFVQAAFKQHAAEREAREARAAERAAKLPRRKYYANGPLVCDDETRECVLKCESHWDAILVTLAVSNLRESEASPQD